MSENTSPESPGVVIDVNDGGGFSLDTFHKAAGIKLDAEQQSEMVSEALSSDSSQITKALENAEDKLEEDAETEKKEGEEASEEAVKAEEQTALDKKKIIKAKLADGKDLAIPKDAIISVKVEGEVVEVPMQELLNNYSGKEAFDQRLSKVASLKENYEKAYQSFNAEKEANNNRQKEILKACEENKPQDALMLMAEDSGVSPAEMMKTFLKNLAQSFNQFKHMTPDAIEAHFHKMEVDWYKSKEHKRKETQSKEQAFNAKVAETTRQLKEAGLEEGDFADAYQELNSGQHLNGKKEDEAYSLVFNHARNKKMAEVIGAAIDEVDPKLRSDRDLIVDLAEHINLAKHSKEDVVYMLKSLTADNGSSASNQSKTKGNTELSEKNVEAKPRKEKVFKSQADLMSSFGMI